MTPREMIVELDKWKALNPTIANCINYRPNLKQYKVTAWIDNKAVHRGYTQSLADAITVLRGA